jgi:two-component system, chemotaxis family, sensor histidine kinase and response regulator WspE
VSAQAVNAMLGMVAQQLVEVDRLRLMAVQAHDLRGDAKQVHDDMEHLFRQLNALGLPDDIGARVASLRHRLQQSRQRLHQHGEHLQDVVSQNEQLIQRLYRTASQVRLRPLRDRLITAPRMVRDLARQLGKSVRLVISGDEAALDRDILERIEAPLTHLLRNALDHGLEPPAERRAAGKSEQGTLSIRARHHAGMLMIEVGDDGRGIDPHRIRECLRRRPGESTNALDIDTMTDDELIEQLFVPGFSMAAEVTEISGRGVGLDVVRTNLHDVDGSVRISSTPGQGTTFHLLVPTSRVVVRTVVVDVEGERYGFPLSRIGKLVRVRGDALLADPQAHHVHVEGMNLRLFSLAALLEFGESCARGAEFTAVVIEHQGKACGFVVDQVLGEFDLSVRPLDARLGRVCDVSAAAVMPDGDPVVLLDVDDLLRSAQRYQGRGQLAMAEAKSPNRRKRVLVVDDSISVRELERHLLMGAGYEVDIAVDGMDAWTKVREQRYDLLVTDVDMPRMDGISLTRSIKQDKSLRRLPVVIVSYRDTAEDRARGLDARADCYVTKSDFHDQRFLALVTELLDERSPLTTAGASA